MLIDGRSRSNLENVRTDPGARISMSNNLYDGELPGHRAVVATLHCRLQAKQGNIPTASYIRDDCLKKEVQDRIQSHIYIV